MKNHVFFTLSGSAYAPGRGHPCKKAGYARKKTKNKNPKTQGPCPGTTYHNTRAEKVTPFLPLCKPKSKKSFRFWKLYF